MATARFYNPGFANMSDLRIGLADLFGSYICDALLWLLYPTMALANMIVGHKRSLK